MWSKLSRTHRIFLVAAVAFALLLIAAGSVLSITMMTRSERAAPLSTVLTLAAQHHVRSAVIDADGTVHVVTLAGQALVTQKEPGQVLAPALTADGAQVSIATGSPMNVIGSLMALLVLAMLVTAALLIPRRRGRAGACVNGRGRRLRAIQPKGRHLQRCGGRRRGQGRTGRGRRVPVRAGALQTRSARASHGRAARAALPAPARRCWRAPWPARPVSPSSASRARPSWRCTSASARRACATSSPRRAKRPPCIVFIDELDAVGGKRSSGHAWRQRRARAHAQPVAGRDGRLQGRLGDRGAWRRRTAPTCSTRRCCARAASTAA